MPQARDEAGNVWETDEAGNAVRLLVPASPAMPTGIGVDPYKASENLRQERSEARAERKEQRESANLDLERRKLIAQVKKAETATVSEGALKVRENADTKLTSAARLANQLAEMREIYSRSFSGEGVGSVKEWLPTDEGQRFQAIAEAMRASLKPLIRGQGEGTFTEGDQKLLDSLIPQPGSFDARNMARFDQIEGLVRDQIELHGPQAGADIQKATAKKLRALSPEAPADNREVATGETRTEKVRTDEDTKIAAMLASGKSGATIKAYAKQKGLSYPQLDSVLAWRSMHPNYKGGYDVSAERVVPTTLTNRVMASPLATIATQAANATTMGTLDEIGGAARSLVTGEPLDETIASANLNKQMQAQANPTSALAGNVLGGAAALVAGGAGAARMGLGQTGWLAANPVKAAALGDAAYGAGYGAGEMNDNRLAGAAVGAPAGLAGSLVGSGLVRGLGSAVRGVDNPAAQRLRAQGIPLTVGEVMGGGMKKTQDALTSIPVVGSMVERRALEGRRAMNEAAFNEAGGQVGVPINQVGQEGIDALAAARSQAYADALDPVSLNIADDAFAESMDPIGNIIARIPENSPARQEAVDALTHTIRSNIEPDGQMTGRNFQEAYRGLARAPRERGNAPYAHEFGQVTRAGQDALAEALERQNPEAFQGFLSANSANRHLNILADAVNAAKNQVTDGDPLFTPAQLGTAATSNTKAFGGKVAAAQGNRPFNQLVRDAQEVMGQKLPESGTAARAAVGLGLTSLGGGGAGYSLGDTSGAVAGTLAPAAVLTMLGTRAGQAALTRALLERTAPFRMTGNVLRNYAPMGGQIGTAATLPFTFGQ